LWALPFFTVLAASKGANAKAGKRHKTTVDWACQMVVQVSRWLKRAWICVADGGYGNLKLGWACRHNGVSLISRLRWDANLYDFAPAYDPHRPGKKRTKGVRLPNLYQRLAQINAPTPTSPVVNPLQHWEQFAPPQRIIATLKWDGGRSVVRHLDTGTAVWDVSGDRPLPIRWVLVIDPQGQEPPAALFSTNLALSPQFIVETFVARWSLEVTFEETRAHLGLQTQRHWSKLATQRTTPVILVLFSSTCLIAQVLHQTQPLQPRSTAWYHKANTTFSDVLERVRAHLWLMHPDVARWAQTSELVFDPTPLPQPLMAWLTSSL
jgi:DDE superfamily endonuclease